MRVVKWIAGIVVALAVVFVGGAYLLPAAVSTERSVVINAPPEQSLCAPHRPPEVQRLVAVGKDRSGYSILVRGNSGRAGSGDEMVEHP